MQGDLKGWGIDMITARDTACMNVALRQYLIEARPVASYCRQCLIMTPQSCFRAERLCVAVIMQAGAPIVMDDVVKQHVEQLKLIEAAELWEGAAIRAVRKKLHEKSGNKPSDLGKLPDPALRLDQALTQVRMLLPQPAGVTLWGPGGVHGVSVSSIVNRILSL